MMFTTSSGRVSRRVLPFSEEVFHAPPMANNKHTKGRPIVPGIRLDSYEAYDRQDQLAEDTDQESMEDFIVSDSEEEDEFSQEEDDREDEEDQDEEQEDDNEDEDEDEDEDENEDEDEDEDEDQDAPGNAPRYLMDNMIEDPDSDAENHPDHPAILDADDCMMDIANEIQAIENRMAPVSAVLPAVVPVRVTLSFMYVPGTDVTLTFTPTQMNEIIHSNQNPNPNPNSRPRRLQRYIQDSDSETDSDSDS